MRRREALQAMAGGIIATAIRAVAGEGEPSPKTGMGLVIHSYWIRSARPLPPDYPPLQAPIDFLRVAAGLGAGGIQTRLGALTDGETRALRAEAEQRQMSLEASVALPKDAADVERFTRDLEIAKSASVKVARTVCLSGRRYETFQSADEFHQFADRSWASLTLAEPVARKLQIQLAVENHKDWRIDEMLGWLKRLDSEWVGVTLDTGNSMALLEEPHAVVEAFAPWTMTLHFKDMAVRECPEGFLLSEVPLGTGCLDLPRIVRTVREKRPDAKFHLEMITRDPLRVPCLTENYWATMPDVLGRDLAETLRRVRETRSTDELPVVSGLSHAEQLAAEAANIETCLAYACQTLQI